MAAESFCLCNNVHQIKMTKLFIGDTRNLSYNPSKFWLPECFALETSPSCYHDDWRLYLHRKNKEDVYTLMAMENNCLLFSLFTRKIVEFFIKVTSDLSLPPEIIYLSVDMNDRFWLQYLCDPGDDYKNHWSSVESNSKYFSYIVALSCMQIASKLSCSSKMITISTVMDLLRKCGYSADKKSIVMSEMLVFRTVGWTMSNITALTYVEMFLEGMTLLLANVDKSELLQVCVKVLNVCYMFHHDIYTKLHIAFQQREVVSSREKSMFLCIEGDSILLAGSVTCAAATMYDPSGGLSANMTRYIGETTRYQYNEVRVLTNIICHVILRHLLL